MSVHLLRADARALPLPDDSVDLVVTSPPYWAQRDYQDGGGSLTGQIGAEATPGEYIATLLDCTAEWMRVLRPTGSLWVNLGDKYATRWSSQRPTGRRGLDRKFRDRAGANETGVPKKSLVGLPWRYALGCIDDLGLTLRAEVIWDKPNGLPESVTDRVRRSHETWLHFTAGPRYYAALDVIREPHLMRPQRRGGRPVDLTPRQGEPRQSWSTAARDEPGPDGHPLGKLPGSVWSIPTQPLDVPEDLEVDHHAAFPMEWPRRLIRGWCPREVCSACGEGLRPLVDRPGLVGGDNNPHSRDGSRTRSEMDGGSVGWARRMANPDRIVGWECDCNAAIPTPAGAGGHGDTSHVTGRAGFGREGRGLAVGRTVTRHEQRHHARQLAGHPQRRAMEAELGRPLDHYAKTSTSSGRPLPPGVIDRWVGRGWLTPAPPYEPAPTRPGVVLDPFSGTGTTAMVADVEGRVGIGAELSTDYLRLARWRVNDPRERAKAADRPYVAPVEPAAGQEGLW